MQPDIHLNWLAVLAAVIANMALGFLWYGPLLGKVWAKEMKIPPDCKPEAGVMPRAMVLMITGSLLTAYVLAHGVQVWRPSTWHAGADVSNAMYGFFVGFFVWIGYYVPVLFSGAAWESKSRKLFSINAGYYFVSLQIMGAILACWR
jgi:hypothetical protein